MAIPVAGGGGSGPATAGAQRAARRRARPRSAFLRSPEGLLSADRQRGPRGCHAGGAGLRRPPVWLVRTRGWATGAPSCSARSRTPTASSATSTSRAPDAHRSPAAATAWPWSVRCCANTSSARPCTPWASPPHDPLPSWRRGVRCSARPSCREPCSPASRAATCAWAASSTPGPRATLGLLRRLADYAITRHHPAAAEAENPYLALFQAVIAAQASLVAQWMLVGFVHGVMNTDNMTISGETIDYGPCAFMEGFDPGRRLQFDRRGRTLRLPQPAGGGGMEPCPARGVAPAPAPRGPGAGGGTRGGSTRRVPPAVQRRLVGGHEGQAGVPWRARRRRDRRLLSTNFWL